MRKLLAVSCLALQMAMPAAPGAVSADAAQSNGRRPVGSSADGRVALDGPPVALVDGEAVTATELVRELVRQYGREVLAKLIYRKVMERAMRQAGITVSEQELEKTVAEDRQAVEFIAPNIKSPHTLEEELRRRFDMTLDEYTQTIVKTRLFVRKMILRDVNPDDLELRLWHARHADRYHVPARIEAAHILLKTPRQADEARARQKLEKIRSRIAAGKISFGKAAKKYSRDKETRGKGGVIGLLPRELKGPLPETAWQLGDGEVSGVVKTSAGLHLVKRIRRLPGENPDFEEVVLRVRQDYLNERVRLEADLWVRDRVRAAKVVRRYKTGLDEFYRAIPAGFTPPENRTTPAASTPRNPEDRQGNQQDQDKKDLYDYDIFQNFQ